MELKKELRLLTDELPSLYMTVPADRLRLLKFGRKVIKKNKYLVEEVEASQKTFTGKKTSRRSVENDLIQLESSVAASDALTTKLKETAKCLETVRAELASVKEQETRGDTKMADSVKVVTEV